MSDKKETKIINKHYKRFRKKALNNQSYGMFDEVVKQSFFCGAMAGFVAMADMVNNGITLDRAWEILEKEMDKELEETL